MHDLHSLINIIRIIRSRNMRWAEHMACIEENEMHTGYWWENLRKKTTTTW
jgi:hypothetical protein